MRPEPHIRCKLQDFMDLAHSYPGWAALFESVDACDKGPEDVTDRHGDAATPPGHGFWRWKRGTPHRNDLPPDEVPSAVFHHLVPPVGPGYAAPWGVVGLGRERAVKALSDALVAWARENLAIRNKQMRMFDMIRARRGNEVSWGEID